MDKSIKVHDDDKANAKLKTVESIPISRKIADAVTLLDGGKGNKLDWSGSHTLCGSISKVHSSQAFLTGNVGLMK